MSCNKSEGFKTREWWMLIVLIITIQWLIHFWSTKAMTSVEMVGYVSFAGTLVSTILAILAIIYSFIQSTSQQTSSEIISREVYRLQDIVNVVNESTVKVNDSLVKLPEIMKQLEELHVTLDVSVQKGIAPIREQHDKMIAMISTSTHLNRLASNSNASESDYISLYYQAIAGLALCSHAINKDLNLEEYYLKFKSDKPDDTANNVDGIFCAAISCLAGYYMEDIIDTGFENKIKKGGQCSDETWTNFIELQKNIYEDIRNTIVNDGFSKNMSEEIRGLIVEMID